MEGLGIMRRFLAGGAVGLALVIGVAAPAAAEPEAEPGISQQEADARCAAAARAQRSSEAMATQQGAQSPAELALADVAERLRGGPGAGYICDGEIAVLEPAPEQSVGTAEAGGTPVDGATRGTPESGSTAEPDTTVRQQDAPLSGGESTVGATEQAVALTGDAECVVDRAATSTPDDDVVRYRLTNGADTDLDAVYRTRGEGGLGEPTPVTVPATGSVTFEGPYGLWVAHPASEEEPMSTSAFFGASYGLPLCGMDPDPNFVPLTGEAQCLVDARDPADSFDDLVRFELRNPNGFAVDVEYVRVKDGTPRYATLEAEAAGTVESNGGEGPLVVTAAGYGAPDDVAFIDVPADLAPCADEEPPTQEEPPGGDVTAPVLDRIERFTDTLNQRINGLLDRLFSAFVF